jgi:hypothetical protein
LPSDSPRDFNLVLVFASLITYTNIPAISCRRFTTVC